ncbi:Asp-tRNA(Asn)/Glu-tRNA(Gln) amidotransferase subunit GatC [Orrella marina]|uniref:Aspartyl/glutamyl-tRNA(Asn/Gln) amidotransferase subunit C n=1 Tax=Orrella marina TaxID=2163011 RepID=A0A2R4XMN8_9BURK|nr:Asp-tRNA(Asn)/Glu-tRNA(Gln) amidotransferase subunit GatC [Orrella marina]AWB35072.1 Asp-tRNA(Asn)/Glu-tRNA(Gln) amidotransferase GatCAB subunit C [Orrella marina]
MALTTEDVARIARLARLELSEEQSTLMQTELNQVLDLIETLQSVDTTGVEPLTHPLSALQDIELRLRTDEALPTNSTEARRQLMANAPAQEEGLFLVPRVIE